MTPERFLQITNKYAELNITLIGDFCLDRYLEIDPSLNETSIETQRTVYNITKVRSQPGGCGTILNNLNALGVGQVNPIGFAGFDGEGYELINSLKQVKCVDLSKQSFIQTDLRRTFTYCKPLVMHPDKGPEELNRLDFKNFSQTPVELESELCEKIGRLIPHSDGCIMLDQVDLPGTGVIQERVIQSVRDHIPSQSVSLCDSRSRINRFEGLGMKVNKEELKVLNPNSSNHPNSPEEWMDHISVLAQNTRTPFFVSLSEDGIVGTDGNEPVQWTRAHPINEEIDIVGAGDCTTANLVCALAAEANAMEAMEIAMAAASVVIHKLGTTGTATTQEIFNKLFPR